MSQDLHIVGARPNFMKAAPVVDALIDAGSRPTLVHTGQHYDEKMSSVFFGQLGLPEPDRDLGVGSGSQAMQTAKTMTALEETFEELRPSRIVVYGDVNSTIAAALVGVKMGIPVAHVEAGLRSFDRSMPEEINRVVTDAISDLHFVTSPEAIGHLAREGIPSQGVHFVGNPMIDTLLRFRDVLDLEAFARQFDLPTTYAIATLHRPANVDDPGVASRILAGLRLAAERLPILLPLHPRGRRTLGDAGLFDIAGVKVVEPLGYLEFMAGIAGAALVITDSGGIQEETTVLGIPCLTLRDNTERPITVTHGTNRLVKRDPIAIIEAVGKALEEGRSRAVPPLWDGAAGGRIAGVLLGG